MGRQLRRTLALAAPVVLVAAAVALAAGPKKGATYSGTLTKNKEPITLKVAKSGKSVTAKVEFAPLYCEGGGAGTRQITKPGAIAKNGAFKTTITYEFTPTHQNTDRLYVSGKFSGKRVTGSARSEFGLSASPQGKKSLKACEGTTSFTAKTK